jgi:hypothetical protein
MKRSLVFSIAVLLTGCFDGYSIKNIDKPLPEYYRLWEKQGETEFDIKKRLFECGWEGGGYIEKNTGALVYMCMERSGYYALQSVDGKRKKTNSWCYHWPDLPACQPGAEIPTPSVERRLNSRYCRVRTSFHACFENSMIARTKWCKSLEYPYVRRVVNWPDRQTCLDVEKKTATERCETRNYTRPPPECLP